MNQNFLACWQQVEDVLFPAPKSLVTTAKLESDGCNGDVMLIAYKSVSFYCIRYCFCTLYQESVPIAKILPLGSNKFCIKELVTPLLESVQFDRDGYVPPGE